MKYSVLIQCVPTSTNSLFVDTYCSQCRNGHTTNNVASPFKYLRVHAALPDYRAVSVDEFCTKIIIHVISLRKHVINFPRDSNISWLIYYEPLAVYMASRYQENLS
jgi:hypothetical protein